LAIESENGVEILIHVGIDTVKLNGEYFYPKVIDGAKVKKGDLLLEFEIEEIKKSGYSISTPVIISNISDYLDIIKTDKILVDYDDFLIAVTK